MIHNENIYTIERSKFRVFHDTKHFHVNNYHTDGFFYRKVLSYIFICKNLSSVKLSITFYDFDL